MHLFQFAYMLSIAIQVTKKSLVWYYETISLKSQPYRINSVFTVRCVACDN